MPPSDLIDHLIHATLSSTLQSVAPSCQMGAPPLPWPCGLPCYMPSNWLSAGAREPLFCFLWLVMGGMELHFWREMPLAPPEVLISNNSGTSQVTAQPLCLPFKHMTVTQLWGISTLKFSNLGPAIIEEHETAGWIVGPE